MNPCDDKFKQRVFEFILNEKMILPGERVLTGVSGGADSVCLLLLMKELGQRLACPVEAVTVQHGIRGNEAEEDVRFVEALCTAADIPLTVCRVDVPAYAKAKGLSEETAARTLRYEEFVRICREHGVKHLALAHHRDDQCETVLHHLFRGSSLKGLSGIAPERPLPGAPECSIVRPLLIVSRQEIEDWLEKKQQTWRTDSTNLDDTYTRNYLRNVLIPEVKRRVNEEAVLHVANASADIREAREFVEELAETWIREHHIDTEKACESDPAYAQIRIPVPELLKLKPILQREVLMRCLGQLAGSGFPTDVSRVHLNQILALCHKENGRWIMLPGQLMAKYEYETLRLMRVYGMPDRHVSRFDALETSFTDTKRLRVEKNTEGIKTTAVTRKDAPDLTVHADTPAPTATVHADTPAPANTVSLSSPIFIEITAPALQDGLRFEENAMSPELLLLVSEKERRNPYTKYLDCDIIKGTLCLRTRKTGDYFLLENGGRKTVKSYMIDKKIPAQDRDRMPLLADGSHVWWMADGRISAACKVHAGTKRILIIHIDKEYGENES